MNDEGFVKLSKTYRLDVVLHGRVTAHFLKWLGGLLYLGLPKADTSFQLP